MSMTGREMALLAAAISQSNAPASDRTTSALIARANRLYRYVNGGVPWQATTEQAVNDALKEDDDDTRGKMIGGGYRNE